MQKQTQNKILRYILSNNKIKLIIFFFNICVPIAVYYLILGSRLGNIFDIFTMFTDDPYPKYIPVCRSFNFVQYLLVNCDQRSLVYSLLLVAAIFGIIAAVLILSKNEKKKILPLILTIINVIILAYSIYFMSVIS